MAVTADVSAPYAPASAVLELVKRHRDRGLPNPVNPDVLGRAGISASLIPRTLQALATLDLIDANGAPTAQFEGIRLAPEVEYKKRLEEWLRAAYADVFAFVDPAKDDSTRIRDAFRGYQPTGQQDRMVTLFQGLCVEAGLIAEKDSETKPTTRTRAKPANNSRTASSSTAKKTTTHSTKGAHGLPPALSGLLDTLPPASEGWTKPQRDKFIATFTAVLDYSIPISAERAKEAAA